MTQLPDAPTAAAFGGALAGIILVVWRHFKSTGARVIAAIPAVLCLATFVYIVDRSYWAYSHDSTWGPVSLALAYLVYGFVGGCSMIQLIALLMRELDIPVVH